MIFVIVILLLTFIAIKKYSPTLPEDNQNEESWATRWSGEIFCFILFCSIVLGINFFYPQIDWSTAFFILLNFILRVGFPAFYIYNFSPLKKYVIKLLKKKILIPFAQSKENVNCMGSNRMFRPPPHNEIDTGIHVANEASTPEEEKESVKEFSTVVLNMEKTNITSMPRVRPVNCDSAGTSHPPPYLEKTTGMNETNETSKQEEEKKRSKEESPVVLNMEKTNIIPTLRLIHVRPVDCDCDDICSLNH